MEMVLIPAGKFLMGSPDSDKNAQGDEKPQHRVRITKPFYLGKYVVTQEQWEAVMGSNPSQFKGPKNPVDSVSWDDCQQFLDKLNAKSGPGGAKFQLPTEAQWEYACRAGSTTRYCFGDEESGLGEYAWYGANSHEKTHPVGEKKPNAWGLYDMHGNVDEWCAEWHDGGYYAGSPTDDPTGPTTGSGRVRRGGGRSSPAGFCRSAYRLWHSPEDRLIDLGFRVAGVPAEPVVGTPSTEAAAPLKIRPIPPQTIEAGKPLSVIVTVENPDAWKGEVRYSLGPRSPPGARIGPQSGAFSWTPAPDQTAGKYDVAVSVEGPEGQTAQTALVVTVTPCLEKETLAADEKAPAAPSIGSRTAEFNKQYGDWKALLSQVRKLRDDYAAAQPTQKPEIEKRFNELIAQGGAKLPELLEAAKGAFQESSANSEVAEFLQAMAIYEAQSENYEDVLPLADLLIEKGNQEPALYNAAGVAAFCVGELDKAEKYLEKGKGAANLGKEFSDLAPRFQGELDYYKKAWPEEVKIRQAEAKADDLPRVLLKTNRGDIELELFENEAPNTVANFISLVEKGFYNGLAFRRVIPYFMAQGGDPKGNGSGGPGYTIPDECHKPDHRLHFRGTLSMACTSELDSGGSQFFLCFLPTQFLDGGFAAFGRVVKGIDVLAKIRRRDPDKQASIEPDKILEAVVHWTTTYFMSLIGIRLMTAVRSAYSATHNVL